MIHESALQIPLVLADARVSGALGRCTQLADLSLGIERWNAAADEDTAGSVSRTAQQLAAEAAAQRPVRRGSSGTWVPDEAVATGTWPAMFYDSPEETAFRRYRAQLQLRGAAQQGSLRVPRAVPGSSHLASCRHEGAPIAGRPGRHAATAALGAGRSSVGQQVSRGVAHPRLGPYLQQGWDRRGLRTVAAPLPLEGAAASARAALDRWSELCGGCSRGPRVMDEAGQR